MKAQLGAAERAREVTAIESVCLQDLAALGDAYACFWPTSAYQTAPSASRQMPSGWSSPSGAHTLRFDNVSSASTSNAVKQFP
jgi:hypothetical protein